MFKGYVSAFEYFDAVRDASLDVERITRQLERMRTPGGHSGLAQRVSATYADVNGTDRSIALMDYEQRVQKRLDNSKKMLDDAQLILYGHDCQGGLNVLMSGPAADVLYWRCVKSSTWSMTADAVGYSRRWCIDQAQLACEQLDAIGPDNAVKGIGIAS